MRDAILDCALPPLQRAGRSVRQMVKRLNQLEDGLSAESQRLARRFNLVGGGGLCSRLLEKVLTAATQYEPQVCVGGCSSIFGNMWLAFTCSRTKLIKHENQLGYLKDKLKKLDEMTTTEQTWRDVTSTYQATLAMIKSLKVQRGVAVLQCIASDDKLLQALGMAKALYDTDGDAPMEVVKRLNDGAGAHIHMRAYTYDKLISRELVRIQLIKDIQLRFVQVATSIAVAIIVAMMNLPLSVYAWIVAGLLLLCCCTCYYRRTWLTRGAKRFWRNQRGWQKVQVAEEAAAGPAQLEEPAQPAQPRVIASA